MPYKEGQRIEVRMPVEVRSGGFAGNTRVSETARGSLGTVHYLDFSSDAALEEATNGIARPVPGDRLKARFSARVGTAPGTLGTTAVTSAAGFTHFVYLNSTSVSAAVMPAPGDLVRAQFTAKVLAGNGVASTRKVEEIAGPGKGTIHNLYLDTRSARRQILSGEYLDSAPGVGEIIKVSFTAPAQCASVTFPPGNFVQVRTDSPAGEGDNWTHVLNTDSLSVNIVPAAKEKEKEEGKPVPARQAYLSGQAVRFEAEVEILTGNTERLGTTRVQETTGPGKGTIHFVYLGGPGTRQEALGSEERVNVGDKVQVTLTGKLARDEPAGSAAQTTEVRTRENYTHFLNLSSPSVTLATPEERAAAVPALTAEQADMLSRLTADRRVTPAYKPGDRVAFEASFEVIRNTGGRSGTSLGTETVAGGRTYQHYVYLNGIDSRTEVLGTGRNLPATGETVKVSLLRGRVISPVGSGPDGTTPVVSPRGYTHYLNLKSPSVTLAAPEPAPATPETPARDAGDVSLLVGEGISSERLLALIAEATVTPGFQAVRARNDEVLFSAATRDECARYIDAEDFDPARVIVREQSPDEARPGYQAVRDRMLAFQEAVSEAIPGPPGASAWELKPKGFFTQEWAKDQVFNGRDDFAGLPAEITEEWPFTFVDWDAAAEEERDDLYTEVTFNGVTFYARAV